jgi:hypothetical protein
MVPITLKKHAAGIHRQSWWLLIRNNTVLKPPPFADALILVLQASSGAWAMA